MIESAESQREFLRAAVIKLREIAERVPDAIAAELRQLADELGAPAMVYDIEFIRQIDGKAEGLALQVIRLVADTPPLIKARGTSVGVFIQPRT